MGSASRIEAVFFTATILEWKRLLKPPKYKDVIIESLRYLVADGRVRIFGFVIMDNHIHLLWQIAEGYKNERVKHSLLKFTAQRIKLDLITYHPQVLEHFRVSACDREYQIWERNPLSIELWSEAVLLQKLNYLHQNPVRAGLCKEAHQYDYSSASFYETGIDSFGFLTRYERSGWEGR